MPVTLYWDDVIDVNAVPADVTLTQTSGNHRVQVDVHLSDISGRFGWTRANGSTAPVGYWKTGDVSGLFTIVGNTTKVDLDETLLNFTTTDMDTPFQPNTANAFVLPYVLYRLFGNSGVLSSVVPSHMSLVTGDPLLTTNAFASAFNIQIDQSSDGTGAAATYTANSLFQELVSKAPGRFSTIPAVANTDVWNSTTAYDDGSNPWELSVGDIIQFTVKFTFSNDVIVSSGGAPVAQVTAGDQYSINLQLHITT